MTEVSGISDFRLEYYEYEIDYEYDFRIAVITDVSGLTCKQGESVNLVLFAVCKQGESVNLALFAI